MNHTISSLKGDFIHILREKEGHFKYKERRLLDEALEESCDLESIIVGLVRIKYQREIWLEDLRWEWKLLFGEDPFPNELEEN